MNYKGIIIGAAVFLSIGICHPLVIKMEYYLLKILGIHLAIICYIHYI